MFRWHEIHRRNYFCPRRIRRCASTSDVGHTLRKYTIFFFVIFYFICIVLGSFYPTKDIRNARVLTVCVFALKLKRIRLHLCSHLALRWNWIDIFLWNFIGTVRHFFYTHLMFVCPCCFSSSVYVRSCARPRQTHLFALNSVCIVPSDLFSSIWPICIDMDCDSRRDV